MSANVGFENKSGLGLNLSYNKNDGFGAGLTYTNKLNKDGTESVKFGLNYSENQGFGASTSYTNKINDNLSSTTGLNFSQKSGLGITQSLSYTNKNSGFDKYGIDQSGFDKSALNLSYSEKDKFSASLDIKGANAFNYSTQNGFSSNLNYTMDKQLADRKAKQDASFEKEQAEKEEAEQKAKEAQKEQGSNVVEGSMREATRRRDDSLVAENDAGDGTMSDAMTPEEKKYNDMKSTYVLGTEADARAYIDANYPEEQREAMHKLLDAEKEKWHDNEKTPEGRAANKALKKDYAAQRTDTGSSEASPTQGSLTAENIKEKAKLFDDMKYEYGATGANGKTVDCSNYVQKLYGSMGMNYKNLGTADFHKTPEFQQVTDGNLKPGDVIIYKATKPNGKYTGHATVYLGNDSSGRMLVTQSVDSEENGGVRVSGVDGTKSYYDRKKYSVDIKYYRYGSK